MNKIIRLIFFWMLATSLQAQNRTLVDRYVDSLRQVMSNRNLDLQIPAEANPYYYQFFFPSTYYSQATRNVFSLDSTAQTPINLMLLRFYGNNPSIVKHYDAQFQNESLLEGPKTDTEKTTDEMKKEIIQAINTSATTQIVDDQIEIDLQVKRPNFWKKSGNFSLKFQQNYFSENWHQGGNNNGTMLATLELSANYNDTKKLTWENRLDVRLGFITTTSDTCHNFLTNNDKLQFNTKLNLKAAKSWSYTISGEAKTQMTPGYKSNRMEKFSDFASPLDASVSIGMDYKPKLKNKNTLSLALLPLSYKLRYIGSHDENIHKNYRFVNRTMSQDYGLRMEFRSQFSLAQNFIWKCRSYCFTSYEYVEAEIENIFTYEFSKYITADFYTLWRFDDNRPIKNYDDNLGYFQFKEYFTLGLKYGF